MIETCLLRQRNLNIYGFSRPSKGPNASGYVHPEFWRGANPEQLDLIAREMGHKADAPNLQGRFAT